MSAAIVRQIRLEREATAARIAATLPAGDYYAAGNGVYQHGKPERMALATSHWDACLIMLAANRSNRHD